MPHNNHTTQKNNQDADFALSRSVPPLDFYMGLAKDWQDPFPHPVLDKYRLSERAEKNFQPRLSVHPFNDVRWCNVVDDSKIYYGSKARFGSLLMSTIQEDTVVYVQPRCGFAGISLTALAQMYGKKLVLFMPASKEVSLHQRWCIENGARVFFHRVAAMPVLNGIAKKWAAENGAFFIPLGLKHPLVTAAAVKVAWNLKEVYGSPPEVWSVISTGVLSRALQIAWTESQFNAVAVARNLHDGEPGRAEIYSYPKPFQNDAVVKPPFESASNYDAKAWQFIEDYGSDGALFWNVAGNIGVQSTERTLPIPSTVSWGEFSEFQISRL